MRMPEGVGQEYRLRIRGRSHPIRILIEPYADEYDLAVGQSIEITASGFSSDPKTDVLELEVAGGSLTVWGWPTSSIRVRTLE